MADSLIQVGQVCEAVWPEDSNWHRATITGIRDLDFVEVSSLLTFFYIEHFLFISYKIIIKWRKKKEARREIYIS